MKVSVVTAYYNRKKLFYNTLLQLTTSAVKDFEVIAVDDGSNDENRLEDLQAEFPFLKVIRLEQKDKWYVNPCVPFNKGFAAATGEIILIQNPECIHYGDILSYVVENLKPNDYISFASYSLDKKTTAGITPDTATDLSALQIDFLPAPITYDGESGWYNHSVHRVKGYHWCAAICAADLKSFGGFDERYALGVAFDDDEILKRIQLKGMNFTIGDSPFVLHQNHFLTDTKTNRSVNPFYTGKDARLLWDKNEYLLNHYTLKKKDPKAKKRSVAAIKRKDMILSTRLMAKKNLKQLSWKIKNKLQRIFKK